MSARHSQHPPSSPAPRACPREVHLYGNLRGQVRSRAFETIETIRGTVMILYDTSEPGPWTRW